MIYLLPLGESTVLRVLLVVTLFPDHERDIMIIYYRQYCIQHMNGIYVVYTV